MNGNVRTMPTGQLMQEYRELLLRLDASDVTQVRDADLYEQEILRRMAW